MVAWLKKCGITSVALQSTGVYWIALYDLLQEADFAVYLVNARYTKSLPGRKSDVQESQWLMKSCPTPSVRRKRFVGCGAIGGSGRILWARRLVASIEWIRF
jgi:transposase